MCLIVKKDFTQFAMELLVNEKGTREGEPNVKCNSMMKAQREMWICVPGCLRLEEAVSSRKCIILHEHCS